MNREQLTVQDFLNAINSRANERFIFNQNREVANHLLNGAPSILVEKDVLQLQRIGIKIDYWKTFLIVVLESSAEINFALKWAANVKDELLNPESADLYLIIGIKAEDLAEEQLLGYESNDLFCRKFFLRTKETIDELLNRSFLSSLNTDGQTDELTDPLYTALLETSKNHAWFNSSYISLWRNEFLSGRSGNELIDVIFGNLPNAPANELSE